MILTNCVVIVRGMGSVLLVTMLQLQIGWSTDVLMCIFDWIGYSGDPFVASVRHAGCSTGEGRLSVNGKPVWSYSFAVLRVAKCIL